VVSVLFCLLFSCNFGLFLLIVTVGFLVRLGLCPDWQDWNPANNVDNATEAMDAAEQWLDVPQVQ